VLRDAPRLRRVAPQHEVMSLMASMKISHPQVSRPFRDAACVGSSGQDEAFEGRTLQIQLIGFLFQPRSILPPVHKQPPCSLGRGSATAREAIRTVMAPDWRGRNGPGTPAPRRWPSGSFRPTPADPRRALLALRRQRAAGRVPTTPVLSRPCMTISTFSSSVRFGKNCVRPRSCAQQSSPCKESVPYSHRSGLF
jgi:hypothetical protein